ncbi:MAG: phage major capsid protein [Clostridiales bacterium]|nr:phage major capsid protein [Clostridiales bacterium]MBQ1570793.1 phage major capsid protein [Clostridiales bacterium]
MELNKATVEELEARKAAIGAEIDNEGADLDALSEEIRSINEELEKRKAEATKRAEIRQAVAAGEGEVVQTFKPEAREEKKMFGVDTKEYRDAWTKSIVKREMSEEERSALASAGAVIPTMTVNAVWDKLVKPAELLGKVDVSQFASYVRFPKATTVNAATGQAVGGEISESSDVVGYVDLIPNEYVKLLTVGADIDHMAIDAIHDWIVDNLTKSIRYAINKDILVGSGSNALKGITQSVNASASALPGTITKASILKIMGALGGAYQQGAIWVMTPEMFYENILTLTQLNDYIINDGFTFRLFGHDVVLMSEALVSSKETIFYGDPSAYKVNIFKALEVKPFETATTTNIQFRGACLADGELLDTSAFVRFAQT